MTRPPEVSCQALIAALAALRAQGISDDGVLDHLPYDRAYLLTGDHWVDWVTFTEFHRRIGERLAHRPGAFFELGRRMSTTGWQGFFNRLARFLPSPLQIFAILPAIIPRFVMNFLTVEFVRTGPSTARLRYRFDQGIKPSDTLLEIFRGTLAGATMHMGRPEAHVEVQRVDPYTVDYHIALHEPQQTLIERLRQRAQHDLRRLWNGFHYSPDAHAELLQVNVVLAQKLEELSAIRDELARANTELLQEAEERERAEEARLALESRMQLAQKLESLGVLAGGIAHDFNNLLVSIISNVELAEQVAGGHERLREHHQRIAAAATRAAELCRLMLAYAGKGRMILEHLDLSEIAREMGDLLQVSSSKKTELRFVIAPALPAVHGDGALIRQIALNLLSNASEALGEGGGQITVELQARPYAADELHHTFAADGLPPGTYVSLRVTDTGCGMDAETQQRAFDPFFTTKFTGRGLGLAAVLGAVRSHHGAVRLVSAPGQGTCFEVLLPAAEPAAPRMCTPPRIPIPLTGEGTVLLVDDELGVREVGQEILESAGYTVLTARNGREAVEVFKTHQHRVACVILDLTMPQMDGVEALRALRHLSPRLRILLISGYSAQEIDHRFAGFEPYQFVAKPFHLSTLLEAVHTTMAEDAIP